MKPLMKHMPFAIALLIAVLAGFGLARCLPQGDKTLATMTQPDDHAHENEHEHEKKEHQHEHETHDKPVDGGDGHDTHEEGVVTLTDKQIEAAGIRTVAVGRGGGQESRLVGRVELALDAQAVINSTVPGRIEQWLASPGDSIQAGQALVTLFSSEAANLRAAADAAQAEAEAARQVYRRDRSLFDQGVIARQELEASQARASAAEATAHATQASLKQAGSPDRQGRLTLTSPLSGYLSSVRFPPGTLVNAGDVLAEVSDPQRSELHFALLPERVPHIAQSGRLLVTGPAGEFEAEVISISTPPGERSRQSLLRAQTDAKNLPAPGTPVTARLVTGEQHELVLPSEAVQTVDGRSVVFVATDHGFRLTPVLTGRQAGKYTEILKGLRGDERVAAGNAFLLKAELAKGEAGHDH